MKRALLPILLGLVACSSPPDRGPVEAPEVTAPGSVMTEVASVTLPEPVRGSSAVAPAAPTASALGPTPIDLASEGFVLDGRCHPRAVKTSRFPTSGEAIGAFRRAWNGCVATQGRAELAFVTESMQRSEHPFGAHKEPCRNAKQRLAGQLNSLSPRLRAFGEVTALDRDGDCWIVDYQGGMKNEVQGILDPADLSMLFAWRVPEG